MKMLGIVAVGVVKESRKFSGHSYVGRIARSSLRQHSFLVLQGTADKHRSCRPSGLLCVVPGRLAKMMLQISSLPMTFRVCFCITVRL